MRALLRGCDECPDLFSNTTGCKDTWVIKKVYVYNPSDSSKKEALRKFKRNERADWKYRSR